MALPLVLFDVNGTLSDMGRMTQHVEEIGAYADGVIVGTALVQALADGGPEAVGALARELAGRA